MKQIEHNSNFTESRCFQIMKHRAKVIQFYLHLIIN